ncbi:hypothetical protein [Nocardia sp. NPDC020380]|uniref:thiolase family protein n=1 Tax=Nocardia sp. NPDC020380 TaxID=3364309 RepID=UPI0037AC4C94
MRRAAIVMPLRTPIGLPGGQLSTVPPDRLIATVIRAATERCGLDPARIETLVTAVPEPHAVRAAAARTGIAPTAGEFPIGSSPGAGLRALITAAMMIQSGAADIILAIGAEYACTPAEPGDRAVRTHPPTDPARPAVHPPAGPMPQPRPHDVTPSRPGAMAGPHLGAVAAPHPGEVAPPRPGIVAAMLGAADLTTGATTDTYASPISVPAHPAAQPGLAGENSAQSITAAQGYSATDAYGQPVAEAFAWPAGVHPVAGTPPPGAARVIGPAGAGVVADSRGRAHGTGVGEPTTVEQAAVLAAAESSFGTAELEYAEMLAQRYGISRVAADEFAATSHRRAARARRQGFFGEETAPVVCAAPGSGNSGAAQLVDRDEGLRDDVSPRAFALLPSLRPDGILTAGNSSARAFGASACLIVAEDRLADLGLAPMGYLTGWTTATAEPDAPVPAVTSAIAKSLWHTGFDLDDLDLLAVDEPSAVEVLALMRALGYEDPDGERLNVHGGTLALGDPGGAAGLCMITTLLHELARSAGGYGLVATSAGPARAVSVIVESAYAVPLEQAPRGARFHGVRARRSGKHRA